MAESVWDYPRPPRVEATSRRITVEADGVVLVDSSNALRVLETSHPPVYYVPVADVRDGALNPSGGRTTVCEYKGMAAYYDVRGRPRSAWSYPDPRPGFEALRGLVAFYPSRFDRCAVDGEVVRAQEGDFYGGWITSDIVGPFKGGPGTRGW